MFVHNKILFLKVEVGTQYTTKSSGAILFKETQLVTAGRH